MIEETNHIEMTTITEIYQEYTDIILLHGMGKIGGIDNESREMLERVNFVYENERPISTYHIKLKQAFDPFYNVGILIKSGNIIAAKNDDGGYDYENILINQMTKTEIINVINSILHEDFTKKYSDFLLNNVSVHGLFYIKKPNLKDYEHADLYNVQNNYNNLNVYEIDHCTGFISLAEWKDNMYIPIKVITNINELLEE